jgi:trans-aconitate methyltransferase
MTMTALRQATYSPDVFNVGDMNQAKRIILTTEGALTTDQRWQTETPYLLSLIEKNIPLNADSVVLDYGCGVGRMSKALIDRFGCSVIGVDISPSMRALAASYVGSPRFMSCAPEMLSKLGVKADAALAIWVLQHCREPADDIGRLFGALQCGGSLFVLNERYRCVPTQAGWVDDGQDVFEMIEASASLRVACSLDPNAVGVRIAKQTAARVYTSWV